MKVVTPHRIDELLVLHLLALKYKLIVGGVSSHNHANFISLEKLYDEFAEQHSYKVDEFKEMIERKKNKPVRNSLFNNNVIDQATKIERRSNWVL